MNMMLPWKTEYRKLITLIVILFVSELVAYPQGQDSIVPVKKDPEKILKNIRPRNLDGGFNFWQDDFNGHWAGIDFGLNTFLKPDYTGYSGEFMKPDFLRSNSMYINLVQQNIGLQKNRNTIGVVTGLGMHFQSYRLDRNTTIERTENGRIEPQFLFFDQNQKSKLSIFSLTVPLLAEFQIPVKHYENRLYLSFGPYASFRLSSFTKIKYRTDRKEKLKVPGHYSIHDVKYGFMFRTGYRWVNLFATYDLVPLFWEEKGPVLHPFTIGCTLLSF